MNFVRYLKAKKIYRIGGLISCLLFILMAFLTVYGQNSGNFVMTVDEDSYLRGIALSDTKDFNTIHQWLTAEPVEEVRDITYPVINIDEALKQDGAYVDKSKYLAYTFYLMNTGTETTNVVYNLKITDEIKNISKAIRILIITGGEDKDNYETFKMYMAEDEVNYKYPNYMPEATIFKDDKTVCTEEIYNLRPNQPKKISIFMWLEGEDPECTPALFGAKIKLSLNFAIQTGKVE